MVKSQPAGRGLELATINPSFVQGPTLSRSGCSSVGLIAQLLTGKIPGTPDLYMNTVDVSDVARAHIRAIVEPEAAGERFILGAKEVRDLAGCSSGPDARPRLIVPSLCS